MKEDRGMADLKELAEQFKAEYKSVRIFPFRSCRAVKLAIEAVFRSWDKPTCKCL